MKPLPPLPCLQAFEAAARLGSFTQAAQERHLTHSAVSRHIQTLEHWCGAALFARSGPKVALTEAGHALAQRLAEPLQSLHQALQSPRETLEVTTLRVFSLASLVSSWLLPRLQDFRERHPDIELHFDTGIELSALPPHRPTVAVRYGSFNRAGLGCDLLFNEKLAAVANPDWFARHGDDPCRWPARQMLRHTYTPWPERAPGPGRQRPALQCAAGMEFNDVALLVQAAALGFGVAWVRTGSLQAYLRSGELVAAEGFGADSDKAYWLAYRNEMATHPAVAAFRDWLLAETAADRAEVERK